MTPSLPISLLLRAALRIVQVKYCYALTGCEGGKMARVRDIGSAELPAEARAVYERFVAGYGPFRSQVAVFAHSPPAVTHLMGLLLELRQSGTVKRRYLELAIVVVSKLNECHYCVA